MCLNLVFYNTINYLTTQMNNKTSFENTTKGFYCSRCKRVRVRKCLFWCRRFVCLSLSMLEVCVADRKAGSSTCEASSSDSSVKAR